MDRSGSTRSACEITRCMKMVPRPLAHLERQACPATARSSRAETFTPSPLSAKREGRRVLETGSRAGRGLTLMHNVRASRQVSLRRAPKIGVSLMRDVAVLAQNLARNCGYAVFPCLATKAPAIPGPGGYKHATTDPEQIARLWRQYPAPLIGIATGARSGISVLDVDRKHASARAWWLAHAARLSPCRAYETLSGGIHLHMLDHDGVVPSTTSRICRGIDTRGEGGFVIYWAAIGFPCLAGLPVLDHTPPQPWPDWLLDALKRPAPAPRRSAPPRPPDNDDHALAGVVRRVASAVEGERNAVTFWAACRCSERGMSQRKIEALILPAATAAGLHEIEARRTIKSAMGRAAA